VPNLVERVEKVKPHFSREQIQMAFQELVALNVLRTEPAR
jgi:hypothetical protein